MAKVGQGAPHLSVLARSSQVRVGHSHSHPSWAVTSASSSPVIVQCMKSSALASDLNSLMDQLAHVLVITHNTFLSQIPCWPSIHLSICPPVCPLAKASTIWRLTWEHVWWKICQDGHWALFQFACSFSLSVSMLANLQAEWLSVAFVLGPIHVHVPCASWVGISSFSDIAL